MNMSKNSENLNGKDTNQKGKKSRKRTKLYAIFAGIFFIVFLVLAVLEVRNILNKRNAEKELEALRAETEASQPAEEEPQETVEATEPEEESRFDPLPEDAAIPEKDIDFEQLTSEVNEDIFAWIYVPGTLVDYPVVRHPTEESYYLNRNLDGSTGYPGCIYVDPINAADFSDPNTVIYGHNMRDDSMFGSLHEYRDRQFFDAHRYIYIYTPEKTLVYRIFAAYEYSDIHLLYSFDLSKKEIFQSYLDQIFDIRDMSANIADDVEVTADDHIVTLSTCIGGKDNMRYLVQGVLIYEQ